MGLDGQTMRHGSDERARRIPVKTAFEELDGNLLSDSPCSTEEDKLPSFGGRAAHAPAGQRCAECRPGTTSSSPGSSLSPQARAPCHAGPRVVPGAKSYRHAPTLVKSRRDWKVRGSFNRGIWSAVDGKMHRLPFLVSQWAASVSDRVLAMLPKSVLFFPAFLHGVAAVNLYVTSYAGNLTSLALVQNPDQSYSLSQTATFNTSTNAPSWLTLNRQNNVLYYVDEAVNATNGTLISYKTSFTGQLTEIQRVEALQGGVYATFFGSGSAIAVPH